MFDTLASLFVLFVMLIAAALFLTGLALALVLWVLDTAIAWGMSRRRRSVPSPRITNGQRSEDQTW